MCSMRVASLTWTFIIRRIIIKVGELASKLTKLRKIVLTKFLIYRTSNYSKVVLYKRNAFIKKAKDFFRNASKTSVMALQEVIFMTALLTTTVSKATWTTQYWNKHLLYCVHYIKGYKRNLLNPPAEFSTASALTRYIDVVQPVNSTITGIFRHSKSPEFPISCPVFSYFYSTQ